MNERIKELAGQTGIIDVALLNDSQSKMLEKFAELIVRECAYQCLSLDDARKIKQHFGVEE